MNMNMNVNETSAIDIDSGTLVSYGYLSGWAKPSGPPTRKVPWFAFQPAVSACHWNCVMGRYKRQVMALGKLTQPVGDPVRVVS